MAASKREELKEVASSLNGGTGMGPNFTAAMDLFSKRVAVIAKKLSEQGDDRADGLNKANTAFINLAESIRHISVGVSVDSCIRPGALPLSDYINSANTITAELGRQLIGVNDADMPEGVPDPTDQRLHSFTVTQLKQKLPAIVGAIEGSELQAKGLAALEEAQAKSAESEFVRRR